MYDIMNWYTTKDTFVQSSNDFIIRAGKPDGKDNPKLVKAYYRKLGQDLLNDVMSISKELEELDK